MNDPRPSRELIPHAAELFIDGRWQAASSEAMIDVVDSHTEQVFLRVAEAQDTDMRAAIAAARRAFDDGPWPRLTHAERAGHLRRLAAALVERSATLAQLWPRQSGVLHAVARHAAETAAAGFNSYAALAETFPFVERQTPTMGGAFGLLTREPVGVVGAIIPWNAPLALATHKVAPALLAGCTVVLKASPEAPGEAYVIAEAAAAAGLPPGALNVVVAHREVSELLVRDPRVDKVTFTGSNAAGRRIASICGERIARVTLELGGKSAAIILDDADIGTAAATLANAECLLSGQVCASLTRVIVSRHRHGQVLDALAAAFSAVTVGDPFDPASQMGPLATNRQRQRVEDYIAKGLDERATLAAGGGRPADVERGWYIQPTVFGDVDNSSTIAREEIFGPVLSVIPARDEQDAVAIANDSIYGLNASVFTPDADRAIRVARQLRTGTVGHNNLRTDFGVGFGGFKQSGIGREGGTQGLLEFLESKTIILDDAPLNV